jgi:antitoxin component YwqK of YwqJK toxin-antitoxin module
MKYPIQALMVSLLSASFFSCVQPGQMMVSKYSPVNQVKTKNGVTVKTGLWVEQGDSTNIRMAIYANGVKQGLSKTVFRTGGYVISQYKDDVLDGKSTTYWNDGKAYREETYVAGKMVSAVNLYPEPKKGN